MFRGRLVIGQMLWDIFHDAWQLYFPDMSFPDAVIVIIMVTAVFLAEERGKPHTRYTLAKAMGMPPETTRKYVNRLIAHGAITRSEEFLLHTNGSIFESVRAFAHVKRQRQRVIKTARTLVRLGPPKMGGSPPETGYTKR